MDDFGGDMFDVFAETTPSTKRKKSAASGATKKRKATPEPKETKLSKRTTKNDNNDNDKDKKAGKETAEQSSSSGATTTTTATTGGGSANGGCDDKIFREFVEQHVQRNLEGKGCWGEVCFPPNFDVANYKGENRPHKPAKEYPFTLDPFQQHAIASIERGESVLVSAHTSAGKTVMAEYAIALSLKNGQRVIYTSPIKALSNQKYRELQEEFGDVGLMTGDITINPSAGCLVMTTEILRNMLYRGSEVMREISWVIFDEVHYMRDRSRGVVWEETMILLPDNVHYVFLSATIPNATEFALWIAKIHNQPCNVVYTDFRPTPLQHYVFPEGGDGLYLVVDDKGNFRDSNLQKALTVMNESDQQSNDKKGRRKKGKKGGGGSDISKIVRLVMERNYHPAIVFSFSKRDVEANALDMSRLDFCDDDEKKLIDEIFNNAIDSLSEDDKCLPQVENLLPLLRRGIGIHHGGLLPILKEVIEILFQEGLLKVLFATETFAMGLNMPAKTVVFTKCQKFDGEKFRLLSSGEYIQMSGRAGRRGLDDRGIVICMIDEDIEPPVCKNMLQGKADCLDSSFHIGYNMLLNLLRVETADPEFMMVRSFFQFQSSRKSPELLSKMDEIKETKKGIVLKDPKAIAEYHSITQQLKNAKQKAQEIICLPIHSLPFINPGRLVEVGNAEGKWGWGVVVNFQKKKIPASIAKASILTVLETNTKEEHVNAYVVDVLMYCETLKDKKTKQKKPQPKEWNEVGELIVVPVLLTMLKTLSKIRLFIPKDLKSKSARTDMLRKLKEVKKRFPEGIPELNPQEDLKIKDPAFVKLCSRMESLEDRLTTHKMAESEGLQEELAKYEKHLECNSQMALAKSDLKSAQQDVVLKQTLKHMKRVLRRLGFTTNTGVIDLKGRVACEISTCDELLATELLFSGFFSDLDPAQIVALVSCLVCEEKSEDKVNLKEELAAPLRQMQEKARRIAEVVKEAKIAIEVEEYVNQFAPHMMDIVYAWCKGAKFSDICKLTDIFEGTIIRVMRRLEELLRQFSEASKVIGNEQLEAKFKIGIASLKRDIVFAASLYL